ncbi:hypothetical protein HDU89_006282 [Geranomyces variabilis]|nr:hypothetical protein HDU89_006282 [Geranomyces variabilis]
MAPISSCNKEPLSAAALIKGTTTAAVATPTTPAAAPRKYKTMRDIFDAHCRPGMPCLNVAAGMVELPPPRILKQLGAAVVEENFVPQYSTAVNANMYRSRLGDKVYLKAIQLLQEKPYKSGTYDENQIMATSGVSGAVAALLSTNPAHISADGAPTVFVTFQRHAREFPEDLAIDSEAARVTYSELDQRSDAVAAVLTVQGTLSAGDAPVAMIVNRSVEMVIGMLAVAKTGVAYVPLSDSFPEKRLADTIASAGSTSILTTRAAMASVPPNFHGKVIVIEDAVRDRQTISEAFRATTDSSAPLMLVFTSGSTGNPKGIVVRHSGISRLFGAMCLSTSTAAPDCHTFSPLHSTETSPRSSLASPAAPTMVMRSNAYDVFATVDVLHTTPTGLSQIEPELYPQIHTLYGPSETSFVVCGGQVSTTGTITVGRPLSETKVFILDDNFNLVPFGEIGLLYVGGLAVTLGYWNDPSETAKKFREFIPGEGIMYATGDLARWAPDNTIQILGRKDNQVKYNMAYDFPKPAGPASA